MIHHSLEPGMWRCWFSERWNVEVSWRLREPDFGVEYGQHMGCGVSTLSVHLLFVHLYLVGFAPRHRPEALNGWSYGFRIHGDCLRIYIGDDTGKPGEGWWTWEFPWRKWHYVGTEPIGPIQTYTYTYELQSGETQVTNATIKPECAEWSWFWKRGPIRRRWRGIEVRFADELGEQTGSFKGGVMGCSYEMRRGEDGLGALRRMERERRFL